MLVVNNLSKEILFETKDEATKWVTLQKYRPIPRKKGPWEMTDITYFEDRQSLNSTIIGLREQRTPHGWLVFARGDEWDSSSLKPEMSRYAKRARKGQKKH